MAYLGQRKVAEYSPNHPWAHTQVELRQQSTQTSPPESKPQNNWDMSQGVEDVLAKLSPSELEEAKNLGF